MPDDDTEPTTPPVVDDSKTFTQAELDRIVSDRLTRERSKFADHADLKAKAVQYDELVAASASEQEKAVAVARKEGAADAARTLAPKLVEANFLAVLAGRIEPDRVREIVAPLDAGYFLDAAGNVDLGKVSTYADGLAPAVAPPARLGPPPTGQGQRPSGPAAPTVAAGRDLYVSRHTKPA